jgi:hypothetical protein
VVIEGQMPWQQGLVDVPAWPFFPVLPCSGNGSALVHWMLTAEVAAILEGDELLPDGINRRHRVRRNRPLDFQSNCVANSNVLGQPYACQVVDGGDDGGGDHESPLPANTPGAAADAYAAVLLEHLDASWVACWPAIRDDLGPEIARRIQPRAVE